MDSSELFSRLPAEIKKWAAAQLNTEKLTMGEMNTLALGRYERNDSLSVYDPEAGCQVTAFACDRDNFKFVELVSHDDYPMSFWIAPLSK